jgi:alpha-L-fucosidase 2
MLMQSHEPVQVGSGTVFEIELLPTLPQAWPTGSVTGLRARGGFEVDLTWREGRLTGATLRSAKGGTTRLRYAGMTKDVTIPAGGSLTWDGR